MQRLRGKKAVVIGGSNGIGSAIVSAFAKEGADVLFSCFKDSRAGQVLVDQAAEFENRLRFISLDAGDISQVTTVYDAALDHLGQVDILVNNAAVIDRTGFLEIKLEAYRRILDVNLQFPFFVCQRFAQHMVAQGIKGSIINISSLSASKAVSRMAHYQCSKAGLSMLTKSAAYELAPHGIRVNTISPGLTASEANRDQWEGNPELWRERGKDIPMGRAGRPTDHAGAAVFLASDESSWITGAELNIDGGEVAV